MSDVEQRILEEARSEVAYADQKASMVLAALGVGFAVVLGGLFASDWSPSGRPVVGQVAWWFGCALASASVLYAALAVWPRTHLNSTDSDIYYWGHVAKYRSLAELEAALDRQQPDARSRTRHQMWELSRIVSRKYTLVRRSFISAGLAVASLGLAGATAL